MKQFVNSLLFLAGISFLLTLVAAIPVEQQKVGRKREEAAEAFFKPWYDIAHMYDTDEQMKVAIAQANWYHKEMTRRDVEGEDPRPPAVDVPGIPFNCDPELGISPDRPTSVHALRPGDIDVIAALGDSITAGNGNGAITVLDVLFENRGESWSVGGDGSLDSNVSTIANMLRKFNPNLNGYSLCKAPYTHYKSWFNVAVPGARADDLLTQANDLVARMKNDTRISFEDDWKMITYFIGGNDFCGYCMDKEERTPEKWKQHMQDSMDVLHREVPKVFVNVVPMAHVGPVQNVTFHHPNMSYPGDPEWDFLYPWLCDVLHWNFCECVMFNDTLRAELKFIQLEYFRVTEELINSRRYDTRDDFTVVLQPHLRDQEPLKDPITGMTDNRYFSPDCFHPNRRMHQVFAYMLWNVMLTRVGEKPLAAEAEAWPEYLCPSEENPFLFTHLNSVPVGGAKKDKLGAEKDKLGTRRHKLAKKDKLHANEHKLP